MGLRAFNKTGVALELKDDAGTTFATLPPSTSAPDREGKGLDIKSEVLLFTAADFAAIEAKRQAGDVVFAWDSVPEFDVGSLVVNFPFMGGIEVVYAPGHPDGTDEGLLGIYTDWERAFGPCRVAADANRSAKLRIISRHGAATPHDSDGFGGFTIGSPSARIPLPANPAGLPASWLGPDNRWNMEGITILDDENPQPGTVVSFEDEAGLYNPTNMDASFIQFVKSSNTVIEPVMFTAKGQEIQRGLGGRYLLTDALASPILVIEALEPFGFQDWDGVGGIGPVEDASDGCIAPHINLNGVFLAMNMGGNTYIRKDAFTNSAGPGVQAFAMIRVWAATAGWSRHSLDEPTFPSMAGLGGVGIARFNGNSERIGQGRSNFSPVAMVNNAASPYTLQLGETAIVDSSGGPVDVHTRFGTGNKEKHRVYHAAGAGVVTVKPPVAVNPLTTVSDRVNDLAAGDVVPLGVMRNYGSDYGGSGLGAGAYANWHIESEYNLSARALDEITATAAETALAAGAMSVATRLTKFTIDATVAYSLADGAVEGQRKSMRATAAINVPDGVLTPANFADGATLTFNAAEQWAELEWHAGGWHLVAMAAGVVLA